MSGGTGRVSITSPSASWESVILPSSIVPSYSLSTLIRYCESLRRLADQDDEQAGGHRVEGSRVPDPLHAKLAAEPCDDVVRGVVARLVHKQHAVEFRGCEEA